MGGLVDGGESGRAIIVDAATVKDQADDDLNYYLLTKIQAGAPCVSYSGFAWTLAGDFKNAADWQRHVAGFAAGLRSPVEVKLEKR